MRMDTSNGRGGFIRRAMVMGSVVVLGAGVGLIGGCEKPQEPVKPPAPTTPKADETVKPKNEAPKPGEDVPPPPPSDK